MIFVIVIYLEILKKLIFLGEKEISIFNYFQINPLNIFKRLWVVNIFFCLSRIWCIVSCSFLFILTLGENFLSDHKNKNIYSLAINLFLSHKYCS